MGFDDGCFATLAYSGHGHFDSDVWCGGSSELGQAKPAEAHGSARRRLAQIGSPDDEARLKGAATYGGPQYQPAALSQPVAHQHFGPLIVSCEHGAIRPLPDALLVDGDLQQQRLPLPAPAVPRFEVIDELVAAVREGVAPLHSGPWARSTLEICLALLESSRTQRDVALTRQVA
jgi:phthalate 4,5-cis-dihydrodiol dehydrogenase